MDDAVRLIALELAKHSLDTFNQDSGNHCRCKSDSRFAQRDGDDPPWETMDEHRAHQVVRVLRQQVDLAMGGA